MRKKALSIALLFSAISANIFAQEANDEVVIAEEVIENEFRIGLTMGGGFSNLRLGDDKNTLSSFAIGNAQGGVTFDIPAGENIFFETGVYFQRKGEKNKIWKEETDKEPRIIKLNLYYLETPITFNYRFNAGKIGIIPQVGPYFAVGVRGDLRATNDEMLDCIYMKEDGQYKYGDCTSVKAFSENGENYKRFDFGIRYGLGFQFNQNVKFNVGYDMGLLNVSDTRNQDGKAKNSTLFGALTVFLK